MQAPCGRQIVKIVLNKINKINHYDSLKNEFPIRWHKLTNTKTRIVFYKENKEELYP